MAINIRAKGANGEREVANTLNNIIVRVMTAQGWPEEEIQKAAKCVQRNQNQSAVGGNDLTNVFGLSIEVKRQETLSINTWWRQCIASALRNKEIPVLIYRQNHQAWNVVMYLQNPLPTVQNVPGEALYASSTMRAEIDWPSFQSWFERWVHRKLLNGEIPTY